MILTEVVKQIISVNFFGRLMKPDRIIPALIIVLVIFTEIIIGVFGVILPVYVSVVSLLSIVLFTFIFVNRQWGLYVLIFTVPLNIGAFNFRNNLASSHLLETACSIPFSWLFVFLVILAWLVRGASKLGHREHIQPTEIVATELLLLLIICWNAITLFWTPNLFEGSIQFVKLLGNICIFSLFFYGIDSHESLRRVIWALLLLGVVLFVLSFFSVFGLKFIGQLGEGRFVMFWKYSYVFNELIDFKSSWKGHLQRGTALMSFNSLPFLTNLIMAFGLGLLLATKEEETGKRFLLKIILILLAFANLTSQSKGGLISLFVMVFFLFIIASTFRKKIIKNSFIFITGLTVLFMLIRILCAERGFTRIIDSTSEFSLSLRIAWWQEMIVLLFQKTIGIGLGIGGTMFYLDPVPYIHSIYFSILCDMGVVGVVLVTFFIGIIVKEVLPIIKNQETFFQNVLLASCGAMIAIGVHGLVDFHYNYSVIWMFAGICMAVLRLAKQELVELKTTALQPVKEK